MPAMFTNVAALIAAAWLRSIFVLRSKLSHGSVEGPTSLNDVTCVQNQIPPMLTPKDKQVTVVMHQRHTLCMRTRR